MASEIAKRAANLYDSGMTVPELLAAIQEARSGTGLSFLPENDR
jgi:hypothetical protein